MNINDAADIIGIARQGIADNSELLRKCQQAAERLAADHEKLLISTHKLAFLDWVQYGLKMAKRELVVDER